MAATEIVDVVIVRKGQALSDGMFGYEEPEEVPVEGSPFRCRIYRRRQDYRGPLESAGGTSPHEPTGRVLSVLDKGARILPQDVALLPACEATGHVAERATVLRPRTYASGIQCDLETGDAGTRGPDARPDPEP